MNEYLENGLEILQKSRSLLGEEDPVSVKLESAMRSIVNAEGHVKVFVEKGEIIEEFQLSFKGLPASGCLHVHLFRVI